MYICDHRKNVTLFDSKTVKWQKLYFHFAFLSKYYLIWLAVFVLSFYMKAVLSRSSIILKLKELKIACVMTLLTWLMRFVKIIDNYYMINFISQEKANIYIYIYIYLILKVVNDYDFSHASYIKWDDKTAHERIYLYPFSPSISQGIIFVTKEKSRRQI